METNQSNSKTNETAPQTTPSTGVMAAEKETCVYCGAEAWCSCWKCATAETADGGQMCRDCAEEHGRENEDGEWMCGGCAEEEDEEEDEESDEEEDEAVLFDRKHPKASCLRCKTKVWGATVMLCGGGGGCCETWYCEDCHEAGTADCPVCGGV